MVRHFVSHHKWTPPGRYSESVRSVRTTAVIIIIMNIRDRCCFANPGSQDFEVYHSNEVSHSGRAKSIGRIRLHVVLPARTKTIGRSPFGTPSWNWLDCYKWPVVGKLLPDDTGWWTDSVRYYPSGVMDFQLQKTITRDCFCAKQVEVVCAMCA